MEKEELMSKELMLLMLDVKLDTYFVCEEEVQKKSWVDDSTSKKFLCWNSIPDTDEISFNDLMVVAKDWAKKYVASIYSGYDEAGELFCTINLMNGIDSETFKEETETESIIKACEWIRTNLL